MSRRNGWRRGKLTELAESAFGQEFYGLHDNGVTFADNQSDITPIQRYIYAIAKDHHTEDYDAKPSGMNRAQSATRGF